MVVVDHHQPGPVLPDCHLIHEVAGEYPHGTLCGVGLALKVLHALHMTRRGAAADRLPKELESMLDLVAVGTIADLASLIGENRYYVREGLKLIAIGQRVGLRALAAVSGCTGSHGLGHRGLPSGPTAERRRTARRSVAAPPPACSPKTRRRPPRSPRPCTS